jgi:hypothetical protein
VVIVWQSVPDSLAATEFQQLRREAWRCDAT